MISPIAYRIRAITDGDRAFIADSWTRSAARARDAREIGLDVFRREHRRLVDRLIARSVIVVAVDDQADDHILGWACGEVTSPTLVPVVHYVYVKALYRRLGIGRALVDAVVPRVAGAGYFTHRPTPFDPRRHREAERAEFFPDIQTCVGKLAPGFRFNPFLLWGPR